jgi:large subunit ribosomal protein L17
MPRPKKAGRFGGTASHHNLILSNLVTELMRHGRIRTTHAKAKTLQPLADRMVTFAKRGDLTARREVLRVIRDKDVVHKLFADVGPAFSERDGGYTRVLKLGPRKGDAAPMALIELVEGVAGAGDGPALDEAPRRRWSLRRRRGTRSVTARARAEERAAAVDRGEEPEFEYAEDEEAGVESPEAAGDSEEGPEVTADEVEARLAAEDGSPDSPESADSADSPDSPDSPDEDSKD